MNKYPKAGQPNQGLLIWRSQPKQTGWSSSGPLALGKNITHHFIVGFADVLLGVDKTPLFCRRW